MSKPLTLTRKIKLFLHYLVDQKDGVLVNCAYCGSADIEFSAIELSRCFSKVKTKIKGVK